MDLMMIPGTPTRLDSASPSATTLSAELSSELMESLRLAEEGMAKALDRLDGAYLRQKEQQQQPSTGSGGGHDDSGDDNRIGDLVQGYVDLVEAAAERFTAIRSICSACCTIAGCRRTDTTTTGTDTADKTGISDEYTGPQGDSLRPSHSGVPATDLVSSPAGSTRPPTALETNSQPGAVTVQVVPGPGQLNRRIVCRGWYPQVGVPPAPSSLPSPASALFGQRTRNMHSRRVYVPSEANAIVAAVPQANKEAFKTFTIDVLRGRKQENYAMSYSAWLEVLNEKFPWFASLPRDFQKKFVNQNVKFVPNKIIHHKPSQDLITLMPEFI